MDVRNVTATTAICAVTALVTLFAIFTGRMPEFAILAGFIPARIQADLLPPDVWAVPAWLTPLTTLAIHTGLLQLGFNIVMLVVTGQKTEDAIGTPAFLLLYAMGAYAAAGALWLAAPSSAWPLLGMTGALSAVIGAYSLLYGQPRNPAIGPFSARTIHVAWLAAAWIVISVLLALLQPADPMLSLWELVARGAAAPIGGFLAGLAAARPLFLWHWRRA